MLSCMSGSLTPTTWKDFSTSLGYQLFTDNKSESCSDSHGEFVSLQVKQQSQNSERYKPVGSIKWPQSEALMLEALLSRWESVLYWNGTLGMPASAPGPRVD